MTADKALDLKRGQRVAAISVMIAFALAIIKAIVGTVCGSAVLIADAVHSGADLLTHAASGIGLWMAARGKTARFPYGLYRAETLACLFVGICILLAGADLFKEGLAKLLQPAGTQGFPLFPIGASLLSAAAAFFISRMESRVGHAIGSQSLVASAKEAHMDIWTSFAVLAGIVLAHFRVPYAEGAIIVLISILIFKIGLENIWGAILVLMDANLDPDLQQAITARTASVPGVAGVEAIKIRQSGPFKMVECIILTRPNLSLHAAHNVADQVEAAIADRFAQIESVFVHVEPDRGLKQRLMVPVDRPAQMASSLYAHFARAPHYLLVDMQAGRVVAVKAMPNPFVDQETHIGVKAARLAILEGIDQLLTASIGEIAFHILNSNQITVYRAASGMSIKAALEHLQHGRLERLDAPVHLIETSLASRRRQLPNAPDSGPPACQHVIAMENT